MKFLHLILMVSADHSKTPRIPPTTRDNHQKLVDALTWHPVFGQLLRSTPPLYYHVTTPFQLSVAAACVLAKTPSKSAVVDDITEFKEFKKLLRTRINVLVLFVKDRAAASATIRVFTEAADHVRGQGTMVLMDCSNRWENLYLEKRRRRRRQQYANEMNLFYLNSSLAT